MKKKGLLAMGLAGVLTVGMCMPVLAAENTPIKPTSDIDGAATPGTATTEVEVIEPIKYSLSIPAKFDVTDIASPIVKLSVSDLLLEPGKAVKVGSQSSEVVLTNSSDNKTTWTMTLKSGDAEFSTVEFTNDDVNEKELKLVKSGNETQTKRLAGTYKGTVAFDITYDDITSVAP